MSVSYAPQRPWRPHETRMALRGRIVVELKPGERPQHIASHNSVSRGKAHPALRVDGGAVDRVLHRFSPRCRVTGAFAARGARWDDLEVDLGLASTLRVEVDPEASVVHLVDALRQLDIVASASPHYLCEAPFGLETWGDRDDDDRDDHARARIGADEALEMEPGDTALIVGVVDSGVALDHPELSGRLRPGADLVDMPSPLLSRAVTLFGDVHDRDVRAMDEVGHGTACASLIGAAGRGMGHGVGGACRVLPLRALAGARVAGRSRPTALGALPDIDAAVKRAVDLGARVLNLSFGTPAGALANDDPLPHASTIAYAVRRGCILVAASGNSGAEIPYYPAALPGVITVGSVDPDGQVSSFTTRGPHVDLCAPGRAVRAAGLKGYRRVTGTSFAAPLVAGACALLWARAARRSAALTTADALRVLVASARPLDADDPRAVGAGAGVLHVPSAIRALDALIERSGEVRPPIPKAVSQPRAAP